MVEKSITTMSEECLSCLAMLNLHKPIDLNQVIDTFNRKIRGEWSWNISHSDVQLVMFKVIKQFD